MPNELTLRALAIRAPRSGIYATNHAAGTLARGTGRAGRRIATAGEQLVIHGVERQLEAIRHPKLVEDVREVVLHRLRTEPEAVGHLPVARPLHDGCNDLELAAGQRRGGPPGAPPGAPPPQ